MPRAGRRPDRDARILIADRGPSACRAGPVVGARTGRRIGYDNEHELIDGTQITVPRLAFWFEEYGWSVENHGVDPDVEVIMSPDDWAAGRDTQLETAVRLALEALQHRPAVRPPDARTRPSKRRPPLPPRAWTGPGRAGLAPKGADRSSPGPGIRSHYVAGSSAAPPPGRAASRCGGGGVGVRRGGAGGLRWQRGRRAGQRRRMHAGYGLVPRGRWPVAGRK